MRENRNQREIRRRESQRLWVEMVKGIERGTEERENRNRIERQEGQGKKEERRERREGEVM